MSEIRILHIMDKISAAGSKTHGPVRQVASRVPFYPKGEFKVMLLNLREEDAACDVLRRNGIEVLSLNRGKFDPLTFFDVLRCIRTWRPSILHLHGYASFNFGRLAGWMKGIPVVVQEHFVDERLPAYQKMIDYLLRRCQARGLAVSAAVKTFMVKDRFIPEADVEVLLNGVPVDRIKRADAGEVRELRRTLGIPEGRRIVGTVGRLAEMKGHQYFLDAARKLADRDETIHFVVVGEGPWAGALKEQAAALKLTDRVVFAGYQENVCPFVSMFEVGVVASIFNEGFNTVGLEMLTLGVPLVITDLPCFHDIYRHDRNVLMVPPRDAEALAQAVTRLLGDSELRARLSAGGRAAVEECSMERIAARYVALYREILGNRGAGGAAS